MVNVKICGVTNLSDVRMCVEAGADFIGNIVNIPSSPRSISPEKSHNILSNLPDAKKSVAVLIENELESIKKIVNIIDPDFIQLHGSESPQFVKKVIESVPAGVVKTIHVSGEESVEEALLFSGFCDAILLDTYSKDHGGSGQQHDWKISKEIVNQVKCDVFLAGGLNPENVARAKSIVNPYCLDVSSGVEKKPGIKDPLKVKSFIENSKSAV